MTSETAKLELRDILDELQAKVDRDALRLEALCKELDDVLAAKGRAEEQGLDLAVIWLNARMDLVTERLRVFKDRWHKKVEKVMELKEMFKARFGDDFATKAPSDPA